LSDDRNFDGAVATAERALVYLKQLRTPPVPQNFELLYTYAAGHNAELNEALRDAVFAHARLPEAEIQRLLAAHIPRHRLNAKVGEVGAQMSSELKQVIDTIHTASRSTEDFGQALEELVPQLDRAVSPEQLKTVAEALLLVTRRMAEHSRTLAERAVDSKRLIQDLHQVLEAIGIESLTDDLTGIANRRRFEQVLEIETVEADESADPLCLALVDVDHFKRFNDNFGHQTGDQMLRVVAQTLKHNVKAGDHAAR
jgi:diguanylate cyclase